MKIYPVMLSAVWLVLGGISSMDPLLASPAVLKAKETGSRINVRSAPNIQSIAPHYGLDGDRIDTLKQVKGEDGYTWYYVRFANSKAEGWVRGDFVQTQGSTANSSSSSSSTVKVSQCIQPILSAQGKLQKVKNLKLVSIRQMNTTEWRYASHPPNRTAIYNFVVEGSGGANAMNSPKFLTALSADLIAQCPDAAAASFWFNGSDWGGVFGLVNGKVELFQCIDPGRMETGRGLTSPKLDWGTYICV